MGALFFSFNFFFFFLPASPLSAPIPVQCCTTPPHFGLDRYLTRVKGFSGRGYHHNPDVIASFLCIHVHALLYNHIISRVEAMVSGGRKLQDYL